MAAERLGGQAERAQYGVGEFLAVQCAGDGPAHPVVGERPGLAVQRELGVGGLQGLADDVAAQVALLGGVRLRGPGLLVPGLLRLLGDLLVGAVRQRPGPQRLGRGDLGARAVGGRCAAGAGVLGGPGDPVGGRRVDVGDVDPALGQRLGAVLRLDGLEDERVELGGAPPPARVAGQRDGLGLLVHLAQPEGSRGRLERGPGPVVEGVRGARHLLRVQRGEEGAPVRVRLGEGDLDLQVVGSALDLLDAFVPGVAGRPERGVLAAQRAPLGDEVRCADLPAVAPDGLLVQAVEHDLPGLGVDDLRGFQVVRVQLRPALGVQREERRQQRAGDPGGGAVGVGLEGVEGGGHRVDRPVDRAALRHLGPGRRRDVLRDDGRGGGLVVARAAAGEYGEAEHPGGEEGERAALSGCPARDADVGHD